MLKTIEKLIADECKDLLPKLLPLEDTDLPAPNTNDVGRRGPDGVMYSLPELQASLSVFEKFGRYFPDLIADEWAHRVVLKFLLSEKSRYHRDSCCICVAPPLKTPVHREQSLLLHARAKDAGFACGILVGELSMTDGFMCIAFVSSHNDRDTLAHQVFSFLRALKDDAKELGIPLFDPAEKTTTGLEIGVAFGPMSFEEDDSTSVNEVLITRRVGAADGSTANKAGHLAKRKLSGILDENAMKICPGSLRFCYRENGINLPKYFLDVSKLHRKQKFIDGTDTVCSLLAADLSNLCSNWPSRPRGRSMSTEEYAILAVDIDIGNNSMASSIVPSSLNTFKHRLREQVQSLLDLGVIIGPWAGDGVTLVRVISPGEQAYSAHVRSALLMALLKIVDDAAAFDHGDPYYVRVGVGYSNVRCSVRNLFAGNATDNPEVQRLRTTALDMAYKLQNSKMLKKLNPGLDFLACACDLIQQTGSSENDSIYNTITSRLHKVSIEDGLKCYYITADNRTSKL
ncbi:MAG TPA: hypothetical protein PKC67_12730 [Kiritimatiellia bacterium]|nr:hypothetical protein [Kiritimatiellia bacterium]HMP35202.1 hypothetical protein [Kiritimatiellia bacterium]